MTSPHAAPRHDPETAQEALLRAGFHGRAAVAETLAALRALLDAAALASSGQASEAHRVLGPAAKLLEGLEADLDEGVPLDDVGVGEDPAARDDRARARLVKGEALLPRRHGVGQDGCDVDLDDGGGRVGGGWGGVPHRVDGCGGDK